MSKLSDEMTKVAKKKRKDEKRALEEKKEAEKRAKREKKLEEKQKKEEETRKKEAVANTKKVKANLAKDVKSILSKVMEVYPHMQGNYINENGVELIKDKEGNIMGMADGFAFISNSEGNISFYSKPKQGNSYYFYAPMKDDNYQCWFDYTKVTARLGAFKTFSIRPDDVEFKTEIVCEHAYVAPKQEEIDEVYNKLKFAKIENAISSMRTQSVKR